jgi:hypothetical protein
MTVRTKSGLICYEDTFVCVCIFKDRYLYVLQKKVIHKFKNNISLLLVLVFFLPTIVKLDHHHTLAECTTHHRTHYHEFQGKCAICEFEFSFFLADSWELDFQEENPVICYCNNYESVYSSNLSQYTFLLRAPPLLTMSI